MQYNIQEELKNIPFLSHLCEDTLGSLAAHAVVKTFPKNTIVISEGDESGSFHIVLSGKVRVYLSNEDGKEVTLRFEGPGQYFGEIALLDDEPRTASVVTVEKSTFGIISKSAFKAWLADYPDAALNIIKDLVQRIRNLTRRLKGLALSDVYGRLRTALNEMAIDDGDAQIISPCPTQQDLATLVGASREMVSKIFKELVIGGYVTKEGKVMKINIKLPESGW